MGWERTHTNIFIGGDYKDNLGNLKRSNIHIR